MQLETVLLLQLCDDFVSHNCVQDCIELVSNVSYNVRCSLSKIPLLRAKLVGRFKMESRMDGVVDKIRVPCSQAQFTHPVVS